MFTTELKAQNLQDPLVQGPISLVSWATHFPPWRVHLFTCEEQISQVFILGNHTDEASFEPLLRDAYDGYRQ